MAWHTSAGMIDGQRAGDMLSGGIQLLSAMQAEGVDPNAQIQLSGAIAALAIVCNLPLDGFFKSCDHCEAIAKTFDRMEKIGGALRVAAARNN